MVRERDIRLILLTASISVASVMGVRAQGLVTYWQQDVCAELPLGGSAKLDWCVETVVKQPSGHMELAVSWSVSGLANGTLDKGSDTANTRMYLVDNLGNRYDHVETGGAAANGGILSAHDPVLRGTFVFPSPSAEAHSLFFRDDDQNIVIRNIDISPRAVSDRTLRASVLGRVMQTETIEIDYRLEGGVGATRESYSLQTGAGGFTASGVRDGVNPITLPSARIPSTDVESFLATLATAPVLERHYTPTRIRRDDHLRITVTLSSLRESIVFYSESQGVGHVPWAVESNGTVFVVPDDTPARALQMLDPFFGRDLASRSTKFLAPHLGEERAREVWTELEETLGAEEAYKTAFRLKDLLGHGRDGEVWAALERHIEEVTTPPEPVPSPLTPDGDSRLVRAARDGDVTGIDTMLRHGADVNEKSPLDGHTALIAASIGNHAPAVSELSSRGADASIRSRTGETALTLAAAKNHLESVRALVETGSESDTDMTIDVDIKGREGKTALMHAAENGYAELVSLLVDSRASVDVRSLRGSTALGLASANRHLGVVGALLGAGANPNVADSYGETPLMRTLHPGVARALIRAGANVNAADEQGRTATMRLSAGDGPRNPDGRGPRRGGGANHLATLEMLLSARADLDAQDLEGRTALIWATTGATGADSHPELLPVLIQAGADVNVRDHKGGTALVYASIHGHLESARILIEAGADVNVRMGRTTALGFALEHQHSELVTLLLRSGGLR